MLLSYCLMYQDARFLAPHTNQILTAIIQGMRKEETRYYPLSSGNFDDIVAIVTVSDWRPLEHY